MLRPDLKHPCPLPLLAFNDSRHHIRAIVQVHVLAVALYYWTQLILRHQARFQYSYSYSPPSDTFPDAFYNFTAPFVTYSQQECKLSCIRYILNVSCNCFLNLNVRYVHQYGFANGVNGNGPDYYCSWSLNVIGN